MQKSAAEQIDIQKRLSSKAEIAFDRAVSRGDLDLAGSNLQIWFDLAHCCTLTAWRSDDQRAPRFLQDTLRVADRAKRLLLEHVGHAFDPASFFFEAASLLQILGRSAGEIAEMPPLPYSLMKPFSDRNLSFLLFERITNRAPSGSWDQALATLASNKRATLAVETYATYGSIIDAVQNGDTDRALDEATKAGLLFSQRSSDRYYCGGPATSGGGPANEFVVDYELAAVQRCLFRAPAPGAELHWWRW